MNYETLKYPSGEFSHQEFADLNGKQKPQVYIALQDALKAGKIVLAGKRSHEGRGKPTNLYKLNDGTVKPLVVATEIKPEAKSTSDDSDETAYEEEKSIENKTSPSVAIAAKPSVQVSSPAPKSYNSIQLEQTCPVCNSKLFAVNDATGVMVWCGMGLDICPSSEAPFGHGKTAKDGYEILISRWKTSSKK